MAGDSGRRVHRRTALAEPLHQDWRAGARRIAYALRNRLDTPPRSAAHHLQGFPHIVCVVSRMPNARRPLGSSQKRTLGSRRIMTSTCAAQTRCWDRVFFSTISLAMPVVVGVGFSRTYSVRIAARTMSPLAHLHGAVFALWMILFDRAVLLVAQPVGPPWAMLDERSGLANVVRSKARYRRTAMSVAADR